MIRDRNANAYLIGVTLQPQLDAAGVKSWLEQASALLAELQRPDEHSQRHATVCVALGASFFKAAEGMRFGLAASQIPVELASPPTMPALQAAPQATSDVLFYIMSTSEAMVATFEQGLSRTHPIAIAAVWVEEGFQRTDRRELSGFLDGLRNVAPEARERVVFLGPDGNPDEPDWAAGGSYVAYIKIRQNLDAMAAKSDEEKQAIIGRRLSDGSRLDLPEGTPVASEGPFTGNSCPASAHVRKVGPRGALHDQTMIFRRGVPYLTLNGDGTLDAGLQFVSFQRSLENFAVIFTRWMTNPEFPERGAGPDALLNTNMIQLEKAGLYFAVPHDDRYIGASIFDRPSPDPCATGRIVVHKQLLDTNGQPILAELGGIAFQVRDASGQAVGEEFLTDSAGHAVSPPVPRNTPLVVHELAPPQGFQQAEDTQVNLTKARTLVHITNKQTPGGEPVYSR